MKIPSKQILLSLLLLVLGLNYAFGTNYYVETDGIDATSQNGSIDQPFKSVSYAATRVTGIDDAIHVGSGTFVETQSISLSPRVHLIGAGETATTITMPEGEPEIFFLLSLQSSGPAIAGDQTVSHLTIDGANHTAWNGMKVINRNNVTIHDVTVKNCYHQGIVVSGPGDSNHLWPNVPDDSLMLSALEIYNCTFLNNALAPAGYNWAYGSLDLYWIKDSTIDHCVFDESVYGGFPLKGVWGNNVKISNCSLKVAAQMPAGSLRAKGFGLEFIHLFNSDIFDNTTNGGISIPKSRDTIIHHNSVIMPEGEERTQAFELGGYDCQLFSNYIDGAGFGITMWGPGINLTARDNVISNCSSGIIVSASHGNNQDGIYIYNNTIDHSSEVWAFTGIGVRIQDAGLEIQDLRIVNNIISNTVAVYSRGAITLAGTNGNSATNAAGIIDPYISHNLFYNNVNCVDFLDHGATNPSEGNRTFGNPNYIGGSLFPDSYRLSASSPALNAGIEVPLFGGSAQSIPWNSNSPSIGSFVQDHSFTAGQGARVEAEMNYSNPVDIGVENTWSDRNLDSNKSINMFSVGDTIRIHFNVPSDGYYQLWVRVRSGNVLGPTEYFDYDAYDFLIDSTDVVTLTGDSDSVSAYETSGGGVYWGTMKSENVYLQAGSHSIDVIANSSYGMVDYLEVYSIGGRVEAETNYTNIVDLGSSNGVSNRGLDSNESVDIFTVGDTIRVSFDVPFDGNYELWVRVRSGNVLGPTEYFDYGAYEFHVDTSTPVTLIGDANSVSDYDTSGGGVYWGTMKSSNVYLTAGTHSIDIIATSYYGMVDYFELVAP
jgi:hypothetical protein